MRPIIRTSSVCLLMASTLSAGCGLNPDDVGSVLAGAIKPDAFAKLQAYYGAKQRTSQESAARGRPVPRRSSVATTDPEADTDYTTASKMPPLTGDRQKAEAPAGTPKSSPAVVEPKKPEPTQAVVKAPPVIVEPSKAETPKAAVKVPPIAAEPKKAEPAVATVKAPPVIVEPEKQSRR